MINIGSLIKKVTNGLYFRFFKMKRMCLNSNSPSNKKDMSIHICRSHFFH